MLVLGIESSCDETAAAVVGKKSDADASGIYPQLHTNIISSQVTTHAPFGGVVPEVAAREHLTRILEVIEQATLPIGGLKNLAAIAVTRGPGLIGSLLVGLQVAKGLALSLQIPWIGINHLEGHLAAALLSPEPPTYPQIALIVSGGHTHLYAVKSFGVYQLLGGTRDDAAGEAFDKIAKMLGLGYPGGLQIEKAAKNGDPQALNFPRGLKYHQSLDFSFSGLKTAARLYLETYQQQHGALPTGQALADFCAAIEEAIADVLTTKALKAAKIFQENLNSEARAAGGVNASGAPLSIVLGGGVAANTRLRQMLQKRAERQGFNYFVPPKHLCTDNAAMIATAGFIRLARGEQSTLTVTARSRWPLNTP